MKYYIMEGRIYALKDPVTLKIRYIGQTRKSIEERAYLHWRDREQEKNKNNYKANWICKLEKDFNLKPLVVLIESFDFCNNSYLNERERFWIDYYKSIGHNLTNSSGKDYFYVHKKPLSGIKKKIYSYDRDYNEILYTSAREASKITGISYKTISENAKGKYRKLEYVFSFTKLSKEEFEEKLISKYKTNVPIRSIDIVTKEERVFKNQQEAAKYFNCNFRNINFVLKGIRNSCANQKWEYLT